jgi:hypothetical protein
MDKKFIKDLVGMSWELAEVKVALAGLQSESYHDDAIITLQARPKTVILYHKYGLVVHAAAGDPLEWT